MASIRNRSTCRATSFTSALNQFLLISSVMFLLIPAVASAQEDAEWAVQAPLAGKALLLDVAVADDALVAVGGRGHILVSADGGTSWKQMEVPTRATLTGVYFHDRNTGWAVGHDSVILRTSDGGTTWERVHWAPEEESPLLDVWFSSATDGFAIGAYGSFYVTFDGGATWDFQPISDGDFHLHHMSTSADGKLYIAAEAGMIYRSDDGGESWIELPSPYDGSFFGTLPLDGDSLLLFGLRGHLFRSDDAGETWQALETGTVGMLTSGLLLDDGTVVITGLGGVLLVSTDSGTSFDLVELDDRRGIQAVAPAGGQQLVLVGEFGVKTYPVSDLARSKGDVTP